jgi:hypothetical protein
MARVVIPVQDLEYNEIDVDEDTASALNTTSDMYIAVGDCVDERMFLRFNITDVSTSDTVTIKAGDGPNSGLGDLKWECDDGTAVVKIIGPLETARFKIINSATDKGKILVDLDGVRLAGTVLGYKVPK